ncbi:hypothetical protein J6590_070295 [Homalodisca vitripennis]|nr:hypothetical protein J6590_070295 [Homalodisca vitripennis]
MRPPFSYLERCIALIFVSGHVGYPHAGAVVDRMRTRRLRYKKTGNNSLSQFRPESCRPMFQIGLSYGNRTGPMIAPRRRTHSENFCLERFYFLRTFISLQKQEDADGEQTGNACLSSEMLICKNRATIDLAEAWSMSWREKNIKTEEQGGEVEVEAGNSKSEVRECLCSCAEKYL